MAQILKSPPKGRVTLRNVGWETYRMLVEEDPDRSGPRIFYDRGLLEIVSPSLTACTIATANIIPPVGTRP